MLTNDKRSLVFELYMKGVDLEEAITTTKLSRKYVETCFFHFGKISYNKTEKSLGQIRSIENRLFEAIENLESKHIIDELQNTYSKFLV